MGRSVGGRTSIEFGSHHSDKTVAVILHGPVVPEDNVIASLSRPCVLSWAKDDGSWWNKHGHPNAGHPYYGPKGVKHIT
jgi:hypothetical protein